MRRFVFTLAYALPIYLASLFFAAPNQAGESKKKKDEPAKISYDKDIQPLLTRYCTTCHSGAKPKGNLNLTFKDEAAARKNPQVWEKVATQLRAGEMPPAGRPKPSLDHLDRVNGWIDGEVLNVDCKGKRDPGRVTIRRLNKSEYNNTIRDLLFINHFKPADDFPTDDVGYGFDNIGDVLSLSPLLLEKYLAAAEKAVELAFNSASFRDQHLLRPKDKKSRMDQAKVLIEAFGARAYRRPLDADELARLLRLFDISEHNGRYFEEGLQLVYQAMLCSPHFLFRIELDRDKKGVGAILPVSDFELANRLSYFLWSSMPDGELFALAEKNQLRKDGNLDKQVRRMLKDKKARALTENFAGQWLQLRSVKVATPDPKLFPTFKAPLREAMIEETERFFEAIVQEDRSILEFIDADYTFVNESLAQHYGIPGVKGSAFQKVKLDANQRGGILTHASVLTVTSNPTRTSPVKRGKWIMENILNTPPPPPPPDAGELPDDEKELKGSLRQRMEQHRAKAICASCHQRMDPLGFAFENYDAIGRWRAKDGKFDIDPAGVLPNGQSFKGARELRKILLDKAPEFRRCLTEKLLTYAIGRGLEYYDKCAVDDICAAVAKNDNRFSSMVIGIVNSDPFQMRKGKGSQKGK